MKILIAGGSSPEEWPTFDPAEYQYVIGVDRGALYLLQAGISLNTAIGDFDSLSPDERKVIFDQAEEVSRSLPEKDDTDTQLGLKWALDRYPKAQIMIIGGTGGRLDHLLANLWLGLEPRFLPYAEQIVLADRQNHFSYYLPGSHEINKQKEMNYLAFCCLTPVEGLTLKETKYTLENQVVQQPTSYASNEFVGSSAQFQFLSGVIAVIQSKD